MRTISDVKALIQTIVWAWGAVLALGGGTVFEWQFFTTKKSDTQGANANPTPSQQTASSLGDLSSGLGGLVQSVGQNSLMYLVGGLAFILLIGGRR